MNAFQLIDALSVSFFGLIGIWAAVVRRHWFLRFAVVCVFLLGTLLVPAYEVVIEFGIQIALISAGVWWVRGRKNWRPRLSLETALLVMVVVAIFAAVAAKVPELSTRDWLEILGTGVITAWLGLVCLWTVFGKARWWKRIFLGLLGIAIFLVLLHSGSVAQHALRRGWSVAVEENYQLSSLSNWIAWFGPSTALGVAITCCVLLLGRKSGWFTEAPIGDKLRSSRSALAAQIGMVAILLLVSMPIFYLFYRLMTPTPYPVVEMPDPNGFDDFVAASRLIDDDSSTLLNNLWSMPTTELKNELEKLAEALEHIDMGASRNACRFRLDSGINSGEVKQAFEALSKASVVIIYRLELLKRTGSVEDRVQEALRALHYGKNFGPELGFVEWVVNWTEYSACRELTLLLGTLDSNRCREVAKELIQQDSIRPDLEELVRYARIADENRGWLTHIKLLLQEWSGDDPYKSERGYFQQTIAGTRFLAVQLALQSYFLDHDRLPDSLDELVPNSLPAIPADPFGSGPLKFRRIPFGFVVSSVGADGMDDGGSGDDIIAVGPMRPDLWRDIQEYGKRLLEKLGI